MSLLRKLERRDVMSSWFAPDPNAIPRNSDQPYLAGPVYAGTTQQAMRHWVVSSCVRLIADIVSTLPWKAYTGNAQEVTPTPSKLVRPSKYANGIEWRWQVMASLLHSGNAYGLIAAEDYQGYPSQVDLLDPARVECKRAASGEKQYKIDGVLQPAGSIWHLPGPQLPGELAGLSPVQYAARTIGLGLAAEKFGSDYFHNGAHPTAVASSEHEIDEGQAKTIKQRIKAAVANRDLAVLGAGLTLTPWQINPEDSQFLDTQRWNAVQICAVFGVPPEMIGAATTGSTVTYSNREQRVMDFHMHALNPWLARIENATSGGGDYAQSWFPKGTYTKFTTAALFRSDLLTRYQAHQIGIEAGFELKSEVREFEELPPIPGIDKPPEPARPALPAQPTGPMTEPATVSGNGART